MATGDFKTLRIHGKYGEIDPKEDDPFDAVTTPVPVFGVLAGLGAVCVLLRRRH